MFGTGNSTQYSVMAYMVVAKLCPTLLTPRGLQHSRLLCPSPSLRFCSNSRPLSQWCYLTISSSATPFSFCPQSFPASGSFSPSWFFASGGQSIGASASASVLPMNIQGWFSLGFTGLISLQYMGKNLQRVDMWMCITDSFFYTPETNQLYSTF